ncbi:Zinc finger CCCH domain-containing protein 19 [Platanthera zijinensis]|uniref:Zinc finger CCCH domain-containing protein 19 n=1 Tax=Platanthera zijinensis TaxID=2320716 RepID=A0AAP0GBW8_9ASPA
MSEAACTGEEFNQPPPPPQDSETLGWLLPEDVFEPQSPLREAEHVPTFEAVQTREEPHRVSYANEDGFLASEVPSIFTEHNTHVSMEGGEASVPDFFSPPAKDNEASSELAQGGAEQVDGGREEEMFEPDSTCVIDSEGIPGYEVEMAGDLVEAAVREFTEEAVESSEEDVEAAEEAIESAEEDVEATGSGDIAYENEFSVAVDVKRRGGRKRKRGGRPTSKLQGTRFPSQKKDEEEVCFICFDGGDLVVCDRRGCPKVYHPSCVNREEAYFQSKGQWSCGWHLCSKCQKSASYKCYTCTYSLCKLCVNEEEFTCIRGNKGFCTACLTTILLMETSENSKEKKDGVDFNDRSCWEYLFKDYWFELKAKLSMNLDELTKARTASKICGLDSGNQESSDDGQGASSDRSSSCHDESISSKKKLKIARTTAYKISMNLQTEGMSPTEDTSSRKRVKNQSRNATPDSQKKEEKNEGLTVHQENSLMIKERKKSRKTGKVDGTVFDTGSELPVSKNNSRKKSKRSTRTDDYLLGAADEQTTVSEYTDWASKELLDFVSHVKNGDKSILSPYEVQELLLDYIKVKKLRDRHKKSQIICDAMLLTLFDKSRVAHFEMLKLLESHIFIKASSPTSDEKQESDTDSIQMGTEVSSDSAEMMISEKRRIPRKRVEGKETNLYSYAAIDVHNISLMYLRRYLMEELIDDMSTFSEKVIGSFVRIRVSASSQRQEVYRLVQVVGCGKAPEEYKTGKRTTDVMLEIINLDKKDVITVDIISNQEFTEEECKRLRQSIKFGFISRLTVGEVEEKARVLQTVRVSEHLESEKLRLTHLRDRASEKGRKKEHRECVEKLHLLNNPMEHVKRLDNVAQAHADPKMDPSYESPEDDGDEDDIKEGNTDRTKQFTFKERELISPRKEGSSNWSTVPKISNNIIASPKKEVEQISNVETQKMEAKVVVLSEKKEPASESTILPELKLEESSSKVVSQPNASENEKLWQYKDPSGKIQGPFSVVQLRKWSKHFPSNLMIWKKSERQEDSILLTDALSGNFKNDLPEWVPANSLHSSSQSPPIISSSKVQETYSVQNDKAASNAARIESVSNLDNKNGTESNDFHKILRHEQVSVHGVSAESNHQAPHQLNRPPVISSELDPRKKFLEEPAPTLENGNNTQKQDLADNIKSDRCRNLGVTTPEDKVVDHSTSSTESNTVLEASQCDHTRMRFNRGGESHTKPIIEPHALESLSPQRSDASTFTKPGPETPQSAYANTLIQIPSTLVNSASGQPSHLVPLVTGPCNWNQHTNTIVGEQPLPGLNSTRTLSDATGGVSTSVNYQIAPLISSDGSMPFSSTQLNNSTSTVTYQPANMSWGTGNTEAVNAPGWQVQTQYQNLSNIAAAVGNLLCGTGVQSGVVNPNLGWGTMAQGNMNMPWVVPPNVNIAWNQGLTLPPQGNPVPNFVRPPPPTQGNVAPHQIWSGPVQANTNQIPSWPVPIVANLNQIPHENNAAPRDSLKDTQSSSGAQRSRDGNFGPRDGGFRGAGSGYSSGRQSRNWMGSGGAERPPRPHQEHTGICLFHRSGHCKKGTSCNFIHS